MFQGMWPQRFTLDKAAIQNGTSVIRKIFFGLGTV